MKKCKSCKADKLLSQFPINGSHRGKDGTIKRYYRDTCKACYRGEEGIRTRARARESFRKMVSWAAPLLLTIVTGIYQYDFVSGRNRVCMYTSVYGDHAVTIDAMRMCPLTWEFDV